MDNALENFYYLLDTFDYNSEINLSLNENSLQISCENEVFEDVLVRIFENHKQFLCVNVINEEKLVKEVKKDFILIQQNKNTNEGNREVVNLKPKLFENPKEEVNKLVSLFGEGSNKCIFCGNFFNKKYGGLTQAAYPFTTKIKSLNGVRSYKNGEYYSFKEYNNSVCPLCFLIGQLGWLTDNLIYRTINNKSFLFLPKLNTIEELNEFKSDYSTLLNNGKFSTLLCFYSKFFLISGEMPNVSWDIFEIPLGKLKNVKLIEFSFDDEILNIIKTFVDEDEDIFNLFNSILFFNNDSKDWNIINEIRENLSESFLKNDFRSFSKNFVLRKGGKITYSNNNIEFLKYFDLLITLWRLNPMSITEDDLKSIKSVGNIISKVSVLNSSLFYKLDKIRSIDDFWRYLSEVSRKLINPKINQKFIRKNAIEDLILLLKRNDNDWEEIKNLLIIYSAIQYSRDSLNDNESNEGNENGN